jgi:exonuclease SbcC
MIKRLKFSVTFPTTGRQFSGDHHFGAGLTTITGVNEAGKSLRIEFIRYALHGSKALRSAATKYKDLKVELIFEVKQIAYRVERAGTKATLSRGDGDNSTWEIIAVGTTAVNAKVAEIFGYGLEVFDSSHAVSQGQIEALGAMQPADRKRMVDQVIGLNVLDGLIKFAGETYSSFNTTAQALEQGLSAPVKPEKPELYDCSANLKVELARLQALKTERDTLRGSIAHEPPAPSWPEDVALPEVSHLEAHQATRQTVVTELAVAKSQHAAMRDPEYTAEEVDAVEVQIGQYKNWLAYDRIMKVMPAPATMLPQEVALQRAYLPVYQQWQADVVKWNRHKTTCPSCTHTWAEDVAEPAPHMEAPNHTLAELDAQERSLVAWANAPASVVEVAVPPFGFEEVKWQREALAKVGDKATLAARIQVLTENLLPDRSEDLKQRRAYDTALARATQQQEAYQAFIERKAVAEARLLEIGDVDTTLALAQARMNAAVIYETQVQAYDRGLLRYDELTQEVARARAEAAEYRKSREALVALKVSVKSHLVPSLNKVASILLSQMTGGKRNVIAVDENFDIKVDGQDIDELSGSAKAVANLSIRIGLGQVLCNRVFGVFMADEVDAAMDMDRAGFTGDALRALTGRVPQVILVTHKTIEADHVLELEAA